MKLATFTTGGQDHVGCLTNDGNHLVDMTAAGGAAQASRFGSMMALIGGGEAALDLAREFAASAEKSGDHLISRRAVTLRAPLPVPAQIRDFSVFPTHIVQSRLGMERLAKVLLNRDISNPNPPPRPSRASGSLPAYYITNRFSVIGPDETVTWPRYSNYMDFELELAAIIGLGGKNIAAENAAEHIFGYTIFNDFSARDTQLVEMATMLGPTKGKSFDMGNAMGPVIVTRDEVPDVRSLRGRARVNGETWTDETCEDMMFSFEEMIAYVSRDETLYAGEVFGSGTIGNGCGLEISRFLADGDEVELDFPAIGVLKNRIVRQAL